MPLINEENITHMTLERDIYNNAKIRTNPYYAIIEESYDCIEQGKQIHCKEWTPTAVWLELIYESFRNIISYTTSQDPDEKVTIKNYSDVYIRTWQGT